MAKIEKIESKIIVEFAMLTRKTMNEAKEKGAEPELLNAIRENLKFILAYYHGKIPHVGVSIRS